MREHNHIFQSVNGVAGCPACDSIDEYHMTALYFHQQYQEMNRGW